MRSSNLRKFSPILKPELIFVFVVALIFRLLGLDAVLAGDELAMVSLWAQMPYEKIFQNYQYPNNHIFLTLILSFLLKSIGLYEWLLRMPTLICGLISIYLGYQAGNAIAKNPNVGVITALFLALSEWHIFYSTNARGYIVIMMLGQICILKLMPALEARKTNVEESEPPQKFIFSSIGWILIWVVGTWTLPTFIFFEVSFSIFLLGLIIFNLMIRKIPINNLLVPLFSVPVGLIAFYWQYYVLISPEMLTSAKSNAAQSSLNSLFGEVMVQWFAPYESLQLIFLSLALTGAWRLWKQSPAILFLLVVILIGPVVGGIVGFKLGLLPGVPHARTYFYLQPFVWILVAFGVFILGQVLGASLKVRLGEPVKKKIMAGVAGSIAMVLLLVAIQNNYKNIYLQRVDRIPYQKLLKFTQSLNPNDLLIVPDDLHVEFYLYGGAEMRQRVENILREGKVDNVYFLEYDKNEKSSFSVDKDNNFINMLGHPPLVQNANGKFPSLPQSALREIDRLGPFVFHKLEPNWLKKKKILEKNLETVGVVGAENFRWEKTGPEKDIGYEINFVDSFIAAFKSKETEGPFSLSLNLMSVSGSDREFSAAFLEGKMAGKQIEYNPAWKINGWALDHPYGSSILNRDWNPVISISSGSGTVAVLDVHFFEKKSAGGLKELLSYEISMPDILKNAGVKKS